MCVSGAVVWLLCLDPLQPPHPLCGARNLGGGPLHTTWVAGLWQLHRVDSLGIQRCLAPLQPVAALHLRLEEDWGGHASSGPLSKPSWLKGPPHPTHVVPSCCQVHQGLRELDAREQQVAVNTAAGAWGSSNSWPPAVSVQELAWLKDTLRGTEARHRELLQAFLGGLPEAANEVSSARPGWGVGMSAGGCWV